MRDPQTDLAGLISRLAMRSYYVRSLFLRRSRFTALLLSLLFAVLSARAGDWDVVRHEGREYVTVASLARFYGFQQSVPAASQMVAPNPAAPLAKQLTLDNGKHQLVLVLNSRLAVIDGVNQWLGFPVTARVIN